MLDSNHTQVIIDGESLQNHVVMAFPYDKPLPDLQDKVRNYTRFIGNRVYSYGKEHGHPSEYDEAVNNATKNRQEKSPYKRLTLTNAGSVIQSICSLLCLQLEQSDDYVHKAKKCHTLDIFELITEHEFVYKVSTVEKVRKSKENSMNNVVTKLFKLK